jgi:hypothetical protein
LKESRAKYCPRFKDRRHEMNKSRTPAALTLSQDGKKLVLAKFRPRMKHHNRLTMRLFCMKEGERSEVSNQSISKCEGCESNVKMTELGVYCSYGLEPVTQEIKSR